MKNRNEFNGRDGFVLIICVGAILFLTLIIYSFTLATNTKDAIAKNQTQDFETTVAAWGGINVGLARLRAKEYQEEAPAWDSLHQSWAKEFTVPEMPGITLTAKVIDEERKINLNFLGPDFKDSDVEANRQKYQVARYALIKLIMLLRGEDGKSGENFSDDLPENYYAAKDLIDRLEDWLKKKGGSQDQSDNADFGTANEEMLASDSAYESDMKKESPFAIVSLGELAIVGFDEDLLYGDQRYSNLVHDGDEEPENWEDEVQPRAEDAPWRGGAFLDYVTIYSRRRVNVNTTDAVTLAVLFYGASVSERVKNDQKVDVRTDDFDFDKCYDEALNVTNIRTTGDPKTDKPVDEYGYPVDDPNEGPADALAYKDQNQEQLDENGEAVDPDKDYSFHTVGAGQNGFMSRIANEDVAPNMVPYATVLNALGMLTVSSRFFMVTATAEKSGIDPDTDTLSRNGMRKTLRAWFERDSSSNFRLIISDAE
ncbi:MAG: general secretion pathway protein GspK [Planctomycetes bacterium]|nr:general secretion pathway protein GspK [Planctomycetota bacterium]